MAGESDRARLIEAAQRLVAQAVGTTPQTHLRIRIETDGSSVTVEATAAELAGRPIPHLTPLEQAVLDAATHDPQPAKVLARKAGKAESRVREALASLCEKGLLVRAPRNRGYHKPGPGN